MSTPTEKEIDYQAYMRKNPPDLPSIVRGPEAREKRREAALETDFVEPMSTNVTLRPGGTHRTGVRGTSCMGGTLTVTVTTEYLLVGTT